MHLNRVTPAVTVAAALLLPADVRAHDAVPIVPGELLRAWRFEGDVVWPMVAVLLLYALGLHRVWSRAGSGRGVQRRQARCFAAGMAVLALALVSPLAALGGALFSAHMTQHVLLMGVAAPLLVLGAPLTAFAWSLPRHARRRIARWPAGQKVRHAWQWLSAPAVAWALHATALWVWHAPLLYAATTGSEAVHAAQHASFMMAALLFWSALRDRTTHGMAVLYLLTTAMQGSILGALLTFAPAPLYAPYQASAPQWGITALQDQQIGGLIMWVPGGLVYFGAALVLLASWLRRADRRAAGAPITAWSPARDC